jgi:3-methyladenine DNA glycosylase AlkD
VTDAIVANITADLEAVATPDRAEREKSYLKSDLIFLGASVPQIRRVATQVHRAHSALAHKHLRLLADALWGRRIHELRMAAVELLSLSIAQLTPADQRWLRGLIEESKTWALVDGLAISVVGALVDHYPAEMDPVIRAWAVDEGLWVRRTSLLAHLPGLRSGAGDFRRFGELADPLLDEKEFYIPKAIGWVLREAGKRRPDDVIAWLEPRVQRASGITVREAVKYLPEADRGRLLEARR